MGYGCFPPATSCSQEELRQFLYLELEWILIRCQRFYKTKASGICKSFESWLQSLPPWGRLQTHFHFRTLLCSVSYGSVCRLLEFLVKSKSNSEWSETLNWSKFQLPVLHSRYSSWGSGKSAEMWRLYHITRTLKDPEVLWNQRPGEGEAWDWRSSQC